MAECGSVPFIVGLVITLALWLLPYHDIIKAFIKTACFCTGG